MRKALAQIEDEYARRISGTRSTRSVRRRRRDGGENIHDAFARAACEDAELRELKSRDAQGHGLFFKTEATQS
jgi:hypothetical protein